MRHTNIFTKTRKESPKDELALNAQILIKAGYVHKEMAGVYSYMPLGIRVLENIKKIAREEMNALDGQEMIMSSLQKKETWEVTDRWDDEKVDIWFKSNLKNGTEIGFGWSHEEPITDMMKSFITSYKDLPLYTYQFQTKFRNELRAKSGIMRGREFVMKDLYSYSKNEEEHTAFYNNMINSYMNFYKRVGLGDNTFVTVASGGVFTKNISHEFQTICDAGEDIIYIDREKNIAYNEETVEEAGVDKTKLEEAKTAEVGNIFSFGGDKSEQMGLLFMDADGKNKPVILGSYGIGITRVMGVVVEKYADDKGLVWPKNISPYQLEIVSLFKERDDKIHLESEKIYNLLKDKYEILFDDRNLGAGPKMADADLYGIPLQIIIGDKSLAKDSVEIKNRQTGEVHEVNVNDVEREIFDLLFTLY
ncbi:prolyl-tRNA synthetase [Candidatus Parcubacteria bacterium]|nr:prolyl-tRNA synthetase [Candidatus Parcubacteria bacterium]